MPQNKIKNKKLKSLVNLIYFEVNMLTKKKSPQISK